MSNFYTSDSFAKVDGVLAAAVADAGTVTLSYPSGYAQVNFNTALADPAYVVINGNDKWNAADSKMAVTFNSSDITLTNNSGTTWAAGATFSLYLNIKDGNTAILLTIPVKLAAITAAGDVVTEIRPGIAGMIEAWEFVVTSPVTTGSKLATLNLEIDTTNVTAGTIALTSAAATPLGKSIQGALITGANTLTAASKLSVEAASVTAFVEGEGFLLIRIRKQ